MRPSILVKPTKLARFAAPTPSELAYARVIRRRGLFDAAFYLSHQRKLHPVYRSLPLRHYVQLGEKWGASPLPGFLPLDYVRSSADVPAATRRPLLHWADHSRPATSWAPHRRVPEPRLNPLPFAVVVHLYFYDVWPELAAALRRIEGQADLFISVVTAGDRTAAMVEQIESEFPDAEVFDVVNRGRDMLPFFQLLETGALSSYNAVAKIHGKKSLHRHDGAQWRDDLVDALLVPSGVPSPVAEGATAGRRFVATAGGRIYEGQDRWGLNRERCRSLLARVGAEAAADGLLRFPAGSMFWVSADVVEQLTALYLIADDFEPEHGQVDGTTAHACERLIGQIAGPSLVGI